MAVHANKWVEPDVWTVPLQPASQCKKESKMTINRAVRVIAGLFVLIAVALGAPASPLYVSSHWLWLAIFIGLSQFQSGLTKFCLMDIILRKAGMPEG